MNAKRVGVEIVIIVILALIAVGAWFYKDYEAAREMERVNREHTAWVDELRLAATGWAESLSEREAEAAFRAFAAGVAPTLLAGRNDTVDQAVGGLLELSGIAFVHVLGPDGEVLASSDRKLMTAGTVGERATWVLASDQVTTRPSERRGLLELAAPVVGSSGPVAYLWMGYDVEEGVEATRPSELEGPGEVREAAPAGS